jgi:hypothetical protein
MNRYIIGSLAFIGLVILLVVILFTGGGSPKKTIPAPLYSYANSQAYVQMVVDGPIVAPQNHNSVKITINRNSANFELIQGYNGHVISSKTFSNSENSFRNFLYALYYAGYSNGTVNSQYPSDIGLCPTGDRYDMYLVNNGNIITHYWVTNCSNTPKTYNGNFGLTLLLFNRQIPNIGTLSQNANL